MHKNKPKKGQVVMLAIKSNYKSVKRNSNIILQFITSYLLKHYYRNSAPAYTNI